MGWMRKRSHHLHPLSSIMIHDGLCMNIIEWSGVQWASHGYQKRTRPSWYQLHRAGHMKQSNILKPKSTDPNQQISPILFLHHEIFRSAEFLNDIVLGEWHSDSWLLVNPGQIFQTATYYFRSGRFWVFQGHSKPTIPCPYYLTTPYYQRPPRRKNTTTKLQNPTEDY